ncbi:MAG: transposase [Chthoniobacterales bacterium]|nr:transposase [Chthoniobacterales bacterium]
MPRQLRIEYEGAIYHVMNRGDQGENIFFDDEDRRKFLAMLARTCIKAGWQVHAYCLMSNHFHLVIETPQPTLVDGMKWLLGVYTQSFNKRHQKRGHLFAGRYKSLIVDGSDDYYLRTVCDYVHLNPARAHLFKQGELLESYPWSSLGDYLKPPSQRASWLRVDRLLGEYQLEKDDLSSRREFARLLNARCSLEIEGREVAYKTIRRSWKFGAVDFTERLVEKMGFVPKKENHFAIELRETMEVKAQRIIKEQLNAFKLNFEDLVFLPCMDPLKVEIAQLLRAQTTLSLKWIADQLKAGTVETLRISLRRGRSINK